MEVAHDCDGDVVISIPQPMLMPILAPRLTGWDQATLTTFLKNRREYQATLRARCQLTNEMYESLVTSIKDSMDPCTLQHVARFTLKKPAYAVTDHDIAAAITRRCNTLKNTHIPDLDKLFREKLKMDLREEDTQARFLNYFMLFDKIIEEHGLEGLLGSHEGDQDYQERMTLRCKYLMANVAPDMLKLEVERLAIARPALKSNEIALYETLVERAREQQHYHLLAMELKNNTRPKQLPKEDAS